jgi:tRNA pseudouridine32 synthase / 23S rRNA pseudouridine746 synthase
VTHLRVLKHQAGLVAIDKPPGLLVIPGRALDDQTCARDLLATQLGCPVWVCHRLDRDTSGVVLFATDAKTHRTVSMTWDEQRVSKRYLALVEGRLAAPLDIDLPLGEGRKGKVRVAIAGEESKASRTLVRVREAFTRASLVECEPLTGRQHQIRVHLKAKGHPLLFDHQYGRKAPLTERDLGGTSDQVVLQRTPLHAAWLAISSLAFEVEAPLPKDMERAVEVLRAAG